jgi:sugar O-acyltransferase (sialic acid O-acetyltransferase NeuD family)
MAHIVTRINRQEPTWQLLGHIAPKATDDTEFAGNPILGSVEAMAEVLAKYPDAMLVADNEFPKSVALPMERLATLIDPDSFIHPTATIGRGCVFYPGTFIGLKSKVGDRVFALGGATINHDDVIEDEVVFASKVTLAGCVHVERGVYLGQSCTIRQFLRIGKNATIGMGAVVVKDVVPNAIMAGNPAKVLKMKEEHR